jgi:hypothetical protein
VCIQPPQALAPFLVRVSSQPVPRPNAPEWFSAVVSSPTPLVLARSDASGFVQGAWRLLVCCIALALALALARWPAQCCSAGRAFPSSPLRAWHARGSEGEHRACVKRGSERKERRGALVVRRQPVRCRTCHRVHGLSTFAQVGVRHASLCSAGAASSVPG